MRVFVCLGDIVAVLGLVCVGIVWYALNPFTGSDWYTVSARSNGDGMVAAVRSYCDAIDWDVPYLVYVHGAGEANADGNLVFSDRADCGAGPRVTWLSPTELKIKTWPTGLKQPLVLAPTIKRAKIGDISIVYAIFAVPKTRARQVGRRSVVPRLRFATLGMTS